MMAATASPPSAISAGASPPRRCYEHPLHHLNRDPTPWHGRNELRSHVHALPIAYLRFAMRKVPQKTRTKPIEAHAAFASPARPQQLQAKASVSARPSKAAEFT